jgi:hypothetical protein
MTIMNRFAAKPPELPVISDEDREDARKSMRLSRVVIGITAASLLAAYASRPERPSSPQPQLIEQTQPAPR